MAVARMLSPARLPEICLSPDVRSPLVVGPLHPRVVLPEQLFEHSTSQQFRAIILHECAHILRHDLWIHMVQRFAEVLFWVHPLVFLLNRRLHDALEEVCDNYVLAQTDGPAYAETLLTVAKICYPLPNLRGYLAMMPRKQNLERRVASLLAEHRDRTTRLPMIQRVVVVASFLLMLGILSSVGLRGAAATPDEASKAASTAQAPPKAQASSEAAKKPAPPAVVGRVTGHVVHARDGRPVVGADVRLRHRDPAKAGTQRTTTNARGEFAFDAVAPGEYRVWSFQGNLASRSRRYQGDSVDVGANGASTPVVLKMQPGLSIRVKVLSLTDGKPISGARVRLIGTDGGADHFTDAQGEVELLALTPETWTIQATAKDHAAVERALNLADKQPATLEINIPPGGSVQGRAQDENGRPLPGVAVTVFGTPRAGYPLAGVETDAEGRYRIDYLPLGQNLLVQLGNWEYPWQTKQLRLDPKGARLDRLDVILKKRPPGAAVRGVVTDPQGKPIGGAEVANQLRLPETQRTETDAQGRFLLENVYPALTGHELVVRAKGFAPQRVRFKPGPASQPAELTVKLQPGHRIRGLVVDEAGKLIPRVIVSYPHGDDVGGMGFGGVMTTDTSGRFQSDSLPDKARFGFRAQGYSDIRDQELPLDGSKEVVVTMKSQGIIKGRVADAATGKLIPRFLVRIIRSPDYQPNEPVGRIDARRSTPGEEFISAQGQFLLKELTAGMSLQVSITADGYRRQVVRCAVAKSASEAETLEIRLRAEDPAKLLTVAGRLVNARGDGVRGADLRLIVATDRPVRRRGGWPFNWPGIESGRLEQAPNVLQVQRRTTTADGSFVFQRVPNDAEIELVYWGKGISRGRMDHLEGLSEKERTALLIRVAASARITGTIDRKVFPEFSDILIGTPGRAYQAAVAADGKGFVIEDVPAGRYSIQVYGPALRTEDRPNGPFRSQIVGRKSVAVEEGKETKVELGEGDRLVSPIIGR